MASPCAGGRYIEVFREKSIPTAKAPPKNSTKAWQGRTLGEHEEEEDLASKKKVQQRDGTWYLEEKHEHSRNGAIR